MLKYFTLALGTLAIPFIIGSNIGSKEATKTFPLPIGSYERQTPTQDEWVIQWNGTPNTDYYVTYGAITTINGVDHEDSASIDGNQLPLKLTFFLEPEPVVTATINLSSNGTASAKIFRNGSLCDSAKQIGNIPAIRVTCFPE